MRKIACENAKGKEYWFEESEFIERPSVYGVCIEDGNVLLVRDILSGSWGIPGGGIDTGEEEFQALQREFLEETGVQIGEAMIELFRDVTYFLAENEEKPWKNIRTVYRVHVISGVLKRNGNKDEIGEVKYFPAEEAVKVLRAKKNNQAIAELLETL